MKILSLAIAFFWMSISVANSNNRNIRPPTTAQIIDILFLNQNSTFKANSFDLGQKCNKNKVGCLLRGVMIGLAQDSYSKENKKQGEKWSQHGWSTANCKLQNRNNYIKYINNNKLYRKSFVKSLRKLKSKTFWKCTVAWGVAKGNVHWSQELRFSLTHIKKKLINNSFAAMNTP